MISKSRSRFPSQLMTLLDSNDHPDIISWLPHGCGFAITDKKRFEKIVLPKYFKVSKYTSFTRRLNRWKFTIQAHGHRRSAYFHPKFDRNNPHLCLEMCPAPQICYSAARKKRRSMNAKKSVEDCRGNENNAEIELVHEVSTASGKRIDVAKVTRTDTTMVNKLPGLSPVIPPAIPTGERRQLRVAPVQRRQLRVAPVPCHQRVASGRHYKQQENVIVFRKQQEEEGTEEHPLFFDETRIGDKNRPRSSNISNSSIISSRAPIPSYQQQYAGIGNDVFVVPQHHHQQLHQRIETMHPQHHQHQHQHQNIHSMHPQHHQQQHQNIHSMHHHHHHCQHNLISSSSVTKKSTAQYQFDGGLQPAGSALYDRMGFVIPPQRENQYIAPQESRQGIHPMPNTPSHGLAPPIHENIMSLHSATAVQQNGGPLPSPYHFTKPPPVHFQYSARNHLPSAGRGVGAYHHHFNSQHAAFTPYQQQTSPEDKKFR